MKKLFASLIVVVLFPGGAHALPQEPLFVPDQGSKLLVQCGMALFDPMPVSTTPGAPQENQPARSWPASDEQHAAPLAAIVPEPSSVLFLGGGLLLGGLVGLRRRASRK